LQPILQKISTEIWKSMEEINVANKFDFYNTNIDAFNIHFFNTLYINIMNILLYLMTVDNNPISLNASQSKQIFKRSYKIINSSIDFFHFFSNSECFLTEKEKYRNPIIFFCLKHKKELTMKGKSPLRTVIGNIFVRKNKSKKIIWNIVKFGFWSNIIKLLLKVQIC